MQIKWGSAAMHSLEITAILESYQDFFIAHLLVPRAYNFLTRKGKDRPIQ